jgi:hypothetical protein
MKFPKWFKYSWWILLLVMTGSIIYHRYCSIIEGNTNQTDIIIMIIFVVLMLVPIFSEIEIYGFKLKKEIENLKQEQNLKILELKNDIRTTQNQTFNATFQGFGPPPPDNKIPELQEEIERILKEKIDGSQIFTETKLAGRIDVPDDNILMFKVRFNIEKQLRRIWEQRFNYKESENLSIHQSLIRIIQDLTKYGIIEDNLYGILREILSICNWAIHGEEVSDSQIDFVAKNSKQILDYLYQVK